MLDPKNIKEEDLKRCRLSGADIRLAYERQSCCSKNCMQKLIQGSLGSTSSKRSSVGGSVHHRYLVFTTFFCTLKCTLSYPKKSVDRGYIIQGHCRRSCRVLFSFYSYQCIYKRITNTKKSQRTVLTYFKTELL